MVDFNVPSDPTWAARYREKHGDDTNDDVQSVSPAFARGIKRQQKPGQRHAAPQRRLGLVDEALSESRDPEVVIAVEPRVAGSRYRVKQALVAKPAVSATDQ
jgi:hypothetical protein